MAAGRKTKRVFIPKDPPSVPEDKQNRDGGKTFLLTEMPSYQWHFWLYRMGQAVGRTGLEFPAGAIGDIDPILMSKIALRALGMMPYGDVRELVGELVGCIRIIRNEQTGIDQPLIGEYGDQDILEVSTLFKLESEVVELHAGFSVAGLLSKSTSAPAETKSPGSSTPATSPAPTPSSSPAA